MIGPTQLIARGTALKTPTTEEEEFDLGLYILFYNSFTKVIGDYAHFHITQIGKWENGKIMLNNGKMK